MSASTHYDEQGFLAPVDILTAGEVAHARAMFDKIEQQLGTDTAQLGLVQRHLDNADIWSLASHPNVVQAAADALGDDVVLVATHFFCKYPSKSKGEKFVAWHQDVTYWGFEPPIAATIWLAIDDADVQNGAMRVIAGSHKVGLIEHGKSQREGNLLSVNQAVPDNFVDESKAVDIILKAGQASVHDGLLIHGSNPNLSDRRRCGLTIRFTTPEIRFTHDPNTKTMWAPMLMRGQDRFGRLKMQPHPTF
jgi:ectoine hydroxylase-related dioxygenase (phytanoyl-CoA dioxygenase family)